MRRGHGIAPVLLALAIGLPPVLNLIAEVRRVKDAGPFPDTRSHGFGADTRKFTPPPGSERGRYVPGRIIDFRSPSSFRSTFFVHYPRAEPVTPGSVVIAPPQTVAGVIVKAWTRIGVALARHVEDPAFRVACKAGDRTFLLSGAGEEYGLTALAGSLADLPGDVVRTSGADGVFPPDLLVGYWRTEGDGTVEPAFSRERGRWVYLWFDPDLAALQRVLGTR
jgi:cell shape-determining protein MreC